MDGSANRVACPCDPSRGGVVYSNPTGTATRVFPSHQREARPANRRGATARKLANLIWHILSKEEDYAWTRPALMQWKIRELELKAGSISRRGGNTPGSARDYSLKTVRDKERKWLDLAESEYRHFVLGWKEKPPSRRGCGKAAERKGSNAA